MPGQDGPSVLDHVVKETNEQIEDVQDQTDVQDHTQEAGRVNWETAKVVKNKYYYFIELDNYQ